MAGSLETASAKIWGISLNNTSAYKAEGNLVTGSSLGM